MARGKSRREVLRDASAWGLGIATGRAFTGSSSALSDDSRSPPGHTLEETGHVPITAPPESNLTTAWKTELSDVALSEPTVAGETVIVGTGHSRVYALNRATGSEKWSFEIDGPVSSTPAVRGGAVYVASDAGTLYALDVDDGNQRWAFKTDDALGAPAVGGDTVYAGSRNAKIYAVDSARGGKRWVFETDAIVSAPVVLEGGRVYAGTRDGEMYAIDATSGNVQWNYPTDGHVLSAPAVTDDVIAFNSDGDLHVVDASTGGSQMTFPFGGGLSPAVDGGTVYVASSVGTVRALDLTDGSRTWSSETQSRIDTPPTLVGTTVFVGGNGGDIYAFDGSNGSLRYRVDTGSATFSNIAVGEGALYIGDTSGAVYALAERGSRIDASGAVRQARALNRVESLTTTISNTLFDRRQRVLRARRAIRDGDYRYAKSLTEEIERAERRASFVAGALGIVALGGIVKILSKLRARRQRTTEMKNLEQRINDAANTVRTNDLEESIADVALKSARAELDDGNLETAERLTELVEEIHDKIHEIRSAVQPLEKFHRKRELDWGGKTLADENLVEAKDLLTDTTGLEPPVEPMKLEKRAKSAGQNIAQAKVFLDKIEAKLDRRSDLLGAIEAIRDDISEVVETETEVGELLDDAEALLTDFDDVDGAINRMTVNNRLETAEERIERAETIRLRFRSLERQGSSLLDSIEDVREQMSGYPEPVTEVDQLLDEAETKLLADDTLDRPIDPDALKRQLDSVAENVDRARRLSEEFQRLERRQQSLLDEIEQERERLPDCNGRMTAVGPKLIDAEQLIGDYDDLDPPLDPTAIEERLDRAREHVDEARRIRERFDELRQRESVLVDSATTLRQRSPKYPGDQSRTSQLLDEADSLLGNYRNLDAPIDPADLEEQLDEAENKIQQANETAQQAVHVAVYELWASDERLSEDSVDSLRSLADSDPDEALAVVPALLEHLPNDDNQRAMVARALVPLAERAPGALTEDHREVVGLLVEQLREEAHRGEILDALEAIATTSPGALEDHIPEIGAALGDEDEAVKRQVCHTLLEIGSEEAIARLRDARREVTDYDLRTEIETMIQEAESGRQQSTVDAEALRRTVTWPEQGGDTDAEADQALPDHEVLEEIGAGGNADVRKIRLAESGDVAALKVPRWQGTLSESVVEEFRSEAGTWARIDDHENVVDVIGSGTTPHPWILLEYVPDGSLRERIDGGGLSPSEARDALLDLCSATRHAHRHGIVHADLKPENVLFEGDSAKVGDWGLARVLLEHSTSIEGMTPTYAAPEQLDPDEYGTVDDQTDVYQLGMIAYEALTGRAPYERSTPAGTVTAILTEEPASPSEHDGSLPEPLDEVVLTAIAKEKSDRYESVLYLRDALRDVAL